MSGAITTVAGSGIPGYGGDGGPATVAELSHPYGVAVDLAGNLYVADWTNYRVRKVTPSGVISTVAGNGIQGDTGDGGLALTAELSDPEGVAVDAAGNVYIAEPLGDRVRKVAPSGIITTVAGSGPSNQPYGRGFSGDGGPATLAQLSQPQGVALDQDGNLYIADSDNNRVRRVSRDGIITTVAGGPAGYGGDGGPATSARLNEPYAIAIDRIGNLYIADNGNSLIRKVTPDGIIVTIAGTAGMSGYSGDGGPATSARLGQALGIAVGIGGVYFADTRENRVREVTPDGTIVTVVGTGIAGYSGDGGPSSAAEVGAQTTGLVVDSLGNLYIADAANNRVRKVTA